MRPPDDWATDVLFLRRLGIHVVRYIYDYETGTAVIETKEDSDMTKRLTWQDALTLFVLPLLASLAVPIADAASSLAQQDPAQIHWRLWLITTGVALLVGLLRFIATWVTQWRRGE